MRSRIATLLSATVTGAILVAAVPAHASNDDDAGSSYFAHFGIDDPRPLENGDLPRSLSFRFASLYGRIVDTAARLAEITHFDWTADTSTGLDIRFESADRHDDTGLLDAETTRRFLPATDREFDPGFSLRIDMSDDGAPLLDPSPRQPGDPIKDHIWLSLGARYHHSERVSLDIGYEHLWVNETTFDRPGGIGNDILGDYRSELDLIGARLRLAFD